MSKRKVTSAYLQTSSSNRIFGAETTLNKLKQPNMYMEIDDVFLYCTNNGNTCAIPLANVKSLELANEEIREIGSIGTTTGGGDAA